MTLIKYPRTPHLEGSRHQIDDDPSDIPFSDLHNTYIVVEEKLDGAHSGISFDKDGSIKLQSRGHFLNGGYREKHFDLLKTWANTHVQNLYDRLGSRYIMFGEWMYAKHTVFYDRLPHFFMEFDVYDRDNDLFLSTEKRRELLAGLPVMPVPIVYEGVAKSLAHLKGLIRPSLYKSADWETKLQIAAEQSKSRIDYVERQTEKSNLAEGLYIKQESENEVYQRMKFVRGDFLQAIQTSDGHWQDRPLLPNKLMEEVDIFAPELKVMGAYDA